MKSVIPRQDFTKVPKTEGATSPAQVARSKRSGVLKIPREVEEYMLEFLPTSTLLSNLRLVDKNLKAFTERYINSKQIRLKILPAPKTKVAPPPAPSTLTQPKSDIPNDFPSDFYADLQYFQIYLPLYKYKNSQPEFNQIWKTILNLLDKPHKNLQLNIETGNVEQFPEDALAEYRPYVLKLNNQPHITELGIYNSSFLSILKQLDLILNLPNLKTLKIYLDDLEDLRVFAPLRELKTLEIVVSYANKYINNSHKYIDFRSILPLAPSIENLKLRFYERNPNPPEVRNLQILKSAPNHLQQLTLNDVKLLEEDLNFKDFPALKVLYLNKAETPNLQTLHLPASITDLAIPSLAKRPMANLWEKLPLMCPQLTTLHIDTPKRLFSLTKAQLAALPELRMIILQHGVSHEEEVALTAALQTRFPGVKIKVHMLFIFFYRE